MATISMIVIRDQGMQAVWDWLNHHSAMITLERRVQIGFGDVNAIFDDLTTKQA